VAPILKESGCLPGAIAWPPLAPGRRQVGTARFAVKVVHLVVEQENGSCTTHPIASEVESVVVVATGCRHGRSPESGGVGAS